jgi:ribosome biogenesis protein Nip4
MRKTITEVLDRGDSLSALESKTGLLQEHSHNFRELTRRKRTKMWLKEKRMWVSFIVGVGILCIVIIVPSGK